MSYARLGLTEQRIEFSNSKLTVFLTVAERGMAIFRQLLDVPNNQRLFEDDPASDVLEPIIANGLSVEEELMGDWGEHVKFRVISWDGPIVVEIESNGIAEKWAAENGGRAFESLKDLILK